MIHYVFNKFILNLTYSLNFMSNISKLHNLQKIDVKINNLFLCQTNYEKSKDDHSN